MGTYSLTLYVTQLCVQLLYTNPICLLGKITNILFLVDGTETSTSIFLKVSNLNKIVPLLKDFGSIGK